MAITSSNFYEILGVDRSADERTIKKAYFALVRKYPPETHPEDFGKLREAYEVLSSADSRKEYDSVGQYDQMGDEVSIEIRAAMQAMESQSYPQAQALLTKLLERKPDLHFARDMLGMAFLQGKDPVKAQAIFDDLVTQHPTSAAYHLHRAYAFHAQKLYERAIPCYLKAKSLDKDDVRPLTSLADCYMDQRRWDEALKVLDEAINLDGTVDFRDFALFVRKLEVELERRNTAAVNQIIEQLMTIVPDDDAARRFVANRLASLAAPLFAQKRVDEANLLMKACSKIDPKRSTGQMPTSFTVPIGGLPDDAKKWLVEKNKVKAPSKVNGSPYALAIFLMLLGLGGLWGAFIGLFATESPLEPEELAGLGALLGGSALLTAWSIRRIAAAAKSPYGAYTIVHPMYLLEVQVDKLTAWPLVNLQDVHITHRSTNGVYTNSTVELRFTRRSFSVSLYGQQASVDWANSVLARRRKMLELLYSGLLEESSEEPTIVPAAMIPDEGAKAALTPEQQAAQKTGRVVYASSLAAAALAVGVALPINARNVEASLYGQATYAYSNKVGAYHRYLERYPDGRFVAEAKSGIAALYDGALAKAKARPPSPLTAALIDVVSALKAEEKSQVRVKYTSHTAFEGLDLSKLPAKVRDGLIDPKAAFTESANHQRESTINHTLEQAFSQLLGEGLVTFDGREDATATFAVDYEVGLTGSIYESVKGAGANAAGDDKKFLGIGFSWDFGVFLKGDEKPRHSFSFESAPAKDIRWTSYGYGSYRGYESPTLPYDKMAESAFEDFQRQLTTRFGARAKDGAAPVPEDDYDDEDDEGYDDEAPPAPPPPAPKPGGVKGAPSKVTPKKPGK